MAAANPEPPRLLSREEIEDVVSVIPLISAAVSTVARNVQQQIRKKISLQLAELKVCPGAIGALKKLILNQFHRSVIHPGEPVGLTSGESIGGPATQMSLKSFHNAGSAKSMGLDAFRELFNVSPERKVESTTLHFKRKDYTFEEMLELRREMVGVTVRGLVIKEEYLSGVPSSDEDLPWEEVVRRLTPRGAWYPNYLATHNIKFRDSQHYLRLTFSKDALYTHKVTLQEIAATMSGNSSLMCMPGGGESTGVLCIPSPMHGGAGSAGEQDAVIDVYVDEGAIRKPLSKKVGGKAETALNSNYGSIALLFLHLCVGPGLSDTVIRGVRRITRLYPVSVTTWSIVRSEELAFPNQSGWEIWHLWLDRIRMRVTGITPEKLAALVEEVGKLTGAQMAVIPGEYWEELGLPADPDQGKTRVTIWIHPGWRALLDSEYRKRSGLEGAKEDQKLKPGHLIDSILQKDAADTRHKENREIEAARLQGRIIFPMFPPSAIHRLGTYVYAETIGTDLRRTLGHRLVDASRTICNNPHEVLATLGIEACRNYLAFALHEMIQGSGSYVNPRYLSMIADFMTNPGQVIPITSRGISRQNRGAFADATFENTMDVFIKAAMAGRYEELISVSACIFTGRRMLHGTGAMRLRLAEEVLATIQKEAPVKVQDTIDIAALETKMNKGEYREGMFQMEDKMDPTVGFDLIFNVPSALPNQISAMHQSPAKRVVEAGVVIRTAPVAGPPLGSGGRSSKGPVPVVEPSGYDLPPWLDALINKAEAKRLANPGLPPLGRLTVNDLLSALTASLNTASADTEQLDIEDFLAD